MTDFDPGDDFTNEYFDRRDLTKPASALDRRLLATQIDDDYSRYHVGDYLDLGLAILVDADWRRLNVLAGLRTTASTSRAASPWTSSCCRAPPISAWTGQRRRRGIGARRRVLDLEPQPRHRRRRRSLRHLVEPGHCDRRPGRRHRPGQRRRRHGFRQIHAARGRVKASLLDETLYLAAAVYEQERTDYSAQSVDTNQAAQTTGAEFEARWGVSDRLLVSLGYSRIEVVNLNTLNAGGRFSFIGADDIPGIPPEAFYGGALGGSIVKPGREGARRAGIPENIVSLTGTYAFGNGLAVSASVVDVGAVHSGFANSVRLPAYTLVNAGFVFERGNWTLTATRRT